MWHASTQKQKQPLIILHAAEMLLPIRKSEILHDKKAACMCDRISLPICVVSGAVLRRFDCIDSRLGQRLDLVVRRGRKALASDLKLF